VAVTAVLQGYRSSGVWRYVVGWLVPDALKNRNPIIVGLKIEDRYTAVVHNSVLHVISGFRREVDENCTLPGYYAGSSDFLQGERSMDFWPLKMGPICCPETSLKIITTRSITTRKSPVLSTLYCSEQWATCFGLLQSICQAAYVIKLWTEMRSALVWNINAVLLSRRKPEVTHKNWNVAYIAGLNFNFVILMCGLMIAL
jgi:hypothetical protein